MCIRRGLKSNDKAMMKATHLGEVNSKIKTREVNSCINPLLTCKYPLTEKNLREDILK